MHDSRVVANRFLELAAQKRDTLTPMQLLKLVYIAHGWMLGLYGRHLIRDEIQAWQYGPVIPMLYDSIRQFRSDPVVGPLRVSEETLSREELSIIDQVYGKYGDITGPGLSRLTHQPGSPWDMTYVDGHFGLRMSNDIIEDHYRRLAQSAAAGA